VNTTRQRNDDQYVMPVEASRRGAHRARVSPLLGVLPFVAVAVVVVGVIGLAWALFGGPGGGSSAQPAGVVSTAPAGGTKSAAAQTSKVPAPPTSSAEPAPSASAAPEPTVDRSSPIVVRNSTRTKGLAARAATALEADGWSINGIPDNYRPTIDSTVFYAEEGQKATASAVAKDLGIDLVTRDAARAPKGVTVILGADWTP
jgi:pyruvate/2-oxoglutarate dehydrogenase complex dihydrolipoamide acyltransferase (E2) component